MEFKSCLVLTQYYAPEAGAPQIRLRSMVRELKKNGLQVYVLTGMPNYPEGKIHAQYKGNLHMEEQIDGITVKRLWLFPAAGKAPIKRLINYLSFTAHACLHVNIIKKFDFVFIEAQPITLALFGYVAKLFFRKPYIYNTPDLQIEFASQRQWINSKFLLSLSIQLENFLMKNSFAVSTVTHAFIDYFVNERKIPKNKITFLPNGVDLTHLSPLPYDQEYAQKLGVAGKLVFTYAGTHADYHGLDVILEAAKVLRDKEEVVFLMVGKGPERNRLIKKANAMALKNIVFGNSPFAEMSQLMSITVASLVVLRDVPASSKMRLSKTFPPLACGVPVIYAGRGESADIVEKHQCGIITLPEDAQGLAAAVEKLSNDRELCKKMGNNGRELVAKEFSWETIVSDWLEQLKQINKK
jgi:glycosyltransferase involved in cell wall biosynthesis